MFHVSQLRKCLRVPEESIPAEAVDPQDTLEYMEYPEKILDMAVKEMRRTTIPYCKVLWSNHTEREATWEKEDDLKEKYPHLFETHSELRDLNLPCIGPFDGSTIGLSDGLAGNDVLTVMASF